MAWKTALFYILLLALGSTLASFSFIIPVLAWHCAFHALASFDAAGNSLPRWRLAVAQEAERWYPLRPFFAWHLCTSLPLILSFACNTAFSCGLWQVDVERNWIQTIHERFPLKAHCFMRSSIEVNHLVCIVVSLVLLSLRTAYNSVICDFTRVHTKQARDLLLIWMLDTPFSHIGRVDELWK